jgi:hypothetical protein
VDRDAFDRVIRVLGRPGSRRTAVGAAVAAMAAAAGSRLAPVAAFDRNCDEFVLAARNEKKFRHVDDNLLVEVQPKNSNRWRVVWDDTDDNNVNFEGEPFRIKRFRAEVGDRLRIRAFNLEGPCDLDEIWLFCANGRGSGRRLLQRFGPDNTCPEGEFLDETVRIRP